MRAFQIYQISEIIIVIQIRKPNRKKRGLYQSESVQSWSSFALMISPDIKKIRVKRIYTNVRIIMISKSASISLQLCFLNRIWTQTMVKRRLRVLLNRQAQNTILKYTFCYMTTSKQQMRSPMGLMKYIIWQSQFSSWIIIANIIAVFTLLKIFFASTSISICLVGIESFEGPFGMEQVCIRVESSYPSCVGASWNPLVSRSDSLPKLYFFIFKIFINL